jgi:predicted RNase H-like HicB family nuclease
VVICNDHGGPRLLLVIADASLKAGSTLGFALYSWVNGMRTQTCTAVVHREDAWYVAECREVGVVSQGKSIEESIANLREATELYLEEFSSPPSKRSTLANWL